MLIGDVKMATMRAQAVRDCDLLRGCLNPFSVVVTGR